MNPVEEIYFYNCTTQVPLPHNVLCQTSTPWNSFTTGWTKRMASTALQDSANVAFLSTDWCAWNTPNHFIWCAQMEKNKMKWKRSCKFTVCPLSGQPFLLSFFHFSKTIMYLQIHGPVLTRKLQSFPAINLPDAGSRIYTVRFYSTSLWKLKPFPRSLELNTSIRV